jgi:subtilisin family serine protease
MFRHPRNQLRRGLSTAALTAGLLASCGSPPLQPQDRQALTPQAATNTVGLPRDYKYLHTLNISAGVSRDSLQKMYGGYIVAYRPELGSAIVANNSATKGTYDGTTVELNAKAYNISEQGFGTWATGFGNWATGFSTWATGYSTWATGTSGTTTATTFKENIPAWNMIQLSEAQSLVPELGQGIKVAVLDTGIDLNHPAFRGKLDTGNARDYIDGDSVPQDVNGTASGFSDGYGHGTATANIVLQAAPRSPPRWFPASWPWPCPPA